VCQEGEFGACFTLNVSLVHSPKLTVIANDEHQPGVGFPLGDNIRFGSLEFIVDHVASLSFSGKGND
jgi:hypothetical protein